MATSQTPCSLSSNVEPPTPTTHRTDAPSRSILMAGFEYFLGKSFFYIFFNRPRRKCPFVTWEGSQGEARTEVAPAILFFWTFYDQKSLSLPGPWGGPNYSGNLPQPEKREQESWGKKKEEGNNHPPGGSCSLTK
jgi:hypothetical protein